MWLGIILSFSVIYFIYVAFFLLETSNFGFFGLFQSLEFSILLDSIEKNFDKAHFCLVLGLVLRNNFYRSLIHVLCAGVFWPHI